MNYILEFDRFLERFQIIQNMRVNEKNIIPYSSDEESNQVFIPFISDVRVKSDSGTGNGGPQSLDGDDNRHLPSNIASLNNPTHSPVVNATASSSNTPGDNRECKFPDIQDKSVSRLTPPSSPHIGSSSHTFGAIGGCAASPPVSLSRER